MLSSIVNPCPIAVEFVVQIQLVDMVEHRFVASELVVLYLWLMELILSRRPIFSSGYDCVMHTHTAEVEVTCVELISVIDKNGNILLPRLRVVSRPFV